jgi:putative transposase
MIRVAFPQTKVRLYIVHRVRGELKDVMGKDSREMAADLKTIYQSATVFVADEALERFAAKWDVNYPTIVQPWRLKWTGIITLFEFPAAIRKAIDTTNAIESVNGVIPKFPRNRKQYPNAESVLKLVYLAIHEAAKKWAMPIVGWKAALNHVALVFEGRMPMRPTD